MDEIQHPREWYPLESSPEVFTHLARQWGLAEQYSFIDVLGLDPELISLVPKPVHGVIFLFPDTPEIVKKRTGEGPCMPVGPKIEPLWIPQVDVGHSCGTFALVHILGQTGLASGLNEFFKSCREAQPAERPKLFGSSPMIYKAHHSAITAGQTLIRPEDWDECDHFLSFVHHEIDGKIHLVELDGNISRNGPLDRGETQSGDLLEDVASAVKEVYLTAGGESLHFSMIALVG
ncbi:hypothetical protein BCR39DRAFT_79834 [Naematelia encephala]|uniref:Ubiquitin carboxyl-terminal hydrolase n=1 Tax=Naematelia encephala TaxID=71784 RepID=A0A1Y2BB69_9TREE|nr:hypothetical protein BCR39DRAFT_79834 [Naematelia encephala]